MPLVHRQAVDFGNKELEVIESGALSEAVGSAVAERIQAVD
jgi:hypothetical protein